MTDVKPWYLSRTIWAAVVTILIAFLGLFEVPTEGIEHGALTNAIMELITAAAGLTAIAGRLAATERIG